MHIDKVKPTTKEEYRNRERVRKKSGLSRPRSKPNVEKRNKNGTNGFFIIKPNSSTNQKFTRMCV